jgi:Glycosyl hydrolases family 43
MKFGSTARFLGVASSVAIPLLVATLAVGPATAAGATNRSPRATGRTPVFTGDFADPFVLQVGARFYAYATNSAGRNVPFGVAGLGRRTGLDGDALPVLPTWSVPGSVWAPSVLATGGEYRLYYTTRDRASGRQCVSVATAATPAGPFVDGSSEPLVCQAALGGSIDASPVVVGDGVSLVWKNDGNCCSLPTRIWSAPLTPDGRALGGPAVAILAADQAWEGGIIEGPSMIANGSRFLLFYSANRWDSDAYATGYAVCETVAGPCEKPIDGPWLRSDDRVVGPGGGSAFRIGHGPAFFVYAAWSPGAVGYDAPGAARRLSVERLAIVNGSPVLSR